MSHELHAWAAVALALLLPGMPGRADGSADAAAITSPACAVAPLTGAGLRPPRGALGELLPLPGPVPDMSGEQSAGQPPPIRQTLGERLDELHNQTCRMMQHVSDRFDGWFVRPGDAPRLAVECPFFVGVESEILNQGAGIESLYDLNFDIRLRLRNLERRMHLFFTTDPLDEFVATEPGDTLPVADKVRHELLAGVGRQLDKLFDVSAGLKAGAQPELFGALKWSHRWHPWEWTVQPSLKGYWTTKQEFGMSGGLLIERWQGPWLLRSASGAKWGQKTREVEWSESMTIGYAQILIMDRRFYSLSQARDFGRGAGLNGAVEGHGSSADLRKINVFYRLPLRGTWLYLHMAPELRWTAERNWATDYGIRVGLDFVFASLCVEPVRE